MEQLALALSSLTGKKIARAAYETKQLQGGTLGDVRLFTGIAESAEGEKLPYKIVWKRQKKWERPGDPNSWRREYDLYRSALGRVMTDDLRWPVCYHAAMNAEESEIQLWMEYIDGVTGRGLTLAMLEQAATLLGRLQGRIEKQHGALDNIPCLGEEGFLAREFDQWHTQTLPYDFLISQPCRMPERLKQMLKNGDIRLVEGKSFEYGFLRSPGCELPEHLKRMLMDIDNRREELFDSLQNLPVVLCHRDFWNENIFYAGGKIRLIDWDTAGWGYLGEDIASLIVDGMEAGQFSENFRRLVPAYFKGFAEYREPPVDTTYILTMVLIKFGYRMLQETMFSENIEEKPWGREALQKIYELKI